MFVRCSSCHTLFRITLDQLEAAEGRVRCGSCLTVFDAHETLQVFDDEPTQKSAEVDSKIKKHARKTKHQPEILQDRADIPSILRDDLQKQEQQRSLGRRLLRFSLTLLLLLVLLLALATQLFYFEREQLAQRPELRPLLEQLCHILECQLPPQRDLSKIELLERNVYSHPNIKGALIINATLINNANYPQPYPKLAISMANLRGQTLVGRVFKPTEYLPDQQPDKMPAGVEINIVLEVEDPGQNALTFELDFL
ncbi:MAG: DUF3426 domain-containing protein [Gammaproteobacteria bacterium]|nr:DUF3426 domain-containing protein [Gammaproteobacteria bacterium]